MLGMSYHGTYCVKKSDDPSGSDSIVKSIESDPIGL